MKALKVSDLTKADPSAVRFKIDRFQFGLTLGARLRAARERKGWSVYRLAQVSGLDHRAIAHYEEGAKAPSAWAVMVLASSLRVRVSTLIALPAS